MSINENGSQQRHFKSAPYARVALGCGTHKFIHVAFEIGPGQLYSFMLCGDGNILAGPCGWDRDVEMDIKTLVELLVEGTTGDA